MRMYCLIGLYMFYYIFVCVFGWWWMMYDVYITKYIKCVYAVVVSLVTFRTHVWIIYIQYIVTKSQV